MNPLNVIASIGDKLIDRFLPDPAAKTEAKLQMLELMQAGEFKEVEAQLERLRIDASDRDSARRMQVETRDKTPRLIAIGYVIGFFCVLAATFVVNIPDQSEPLVNVLLGSLAGGVVQILNYYFGSSAGSKEKGEALNQLARGTK